MKLTLIARCDRSGLGYQCVSYFKHLKPNRVIMIDLSPLNGNEQCPEWYNNITMTIKGIPTEEDIEKILEDTDVLLTAETPYNLELYTIARQRGVKTICVENPEFYDHIKYPQYEMPDLIILPSNWMQEELTIHAESRGTKVIQLHHPVDRGDYPFSLRTGGKVMHLAGKPASNDRNGTWDFLHACPDGIVTTQSDDLAWHIRRRFRHSKVYTGIDLPQQLYTYADIMVLPRKYGGNCLPLNEALSSGMPVIMPDIAPNNNLLPKEWLVPAFKTDSFTPRTSVDIYQVDVEQLSERICWVLDNIETESLKANEIADTISWTKLLPKWQEAIASIL